MTRVNTNAQELPEDKNKGTTEEDILNLKPEQKEEKKKKTKKSQLDELQEKCDEYLAGWKRARADYENLQKETTARIAENIKYGTEELLLELLPMVDHFTYAFKGIPDEEKGSNWLKGIEHIQKNFMKILEAHGVETIPTVGQKFNHEFHEAVEEIEVEGGTSGEIVEEVASGFKLNGKIIRVAKVKVIK